MEFLVTNWIVFGVLTLITFAVALWNFLRTWRRGQFPSGGVVGVHLACMFFVAIFGSCFSIGAIIQIVRYVNAHP